MSLSIPKLGKRSVVLCPVVHIKMCPIRFMEGNGRSTCIWLVLIFKKHWCLCVEWNKIDKKDYLDAMIASHTDSTRIRELLRGAMTDSINDREIFMKGIDNSCYNDQEKWIEKQNRRSFSDSRNLSPSVMFPLSSKRWCCWSVSHTCHRRYCHRSLQCRKYSIHPRCRWYKDQASWIQGRHEIMYPRT
jgi:hypothetical protein